MIERELPDLTGYLVGGKWELVSQMGQGSFGDVWLARHHVTGKRKALKLLQATYSADQGQTERFVREAQAAARIDSPHVVEIDDIGHDDALARAYLVMERLRGESLYDFLTHAPFRVEFAEAVTLMRQIAAAVDAAHAAGVVHRDLKPENVFLSWHSDGSVLLKVLDFGIARLVGAGLVEPAPALTMPPVVAGVGLRRSRTEGFIGTPGYAAPEQIENASVAGTPADIFALGICAFEILTGGPYWHANDPMSLLVETLGGPVDPASTRAPPGVVLPPAFDAWFARVCSRDPMARHATAGEAVYQLEAALGVNDPLPWPEARSSVESLPRASGIARDGHEVPPSDPAPALRDSTRSSAPETRDGSTMSAGLEVSLSRSDPLPNVKLRRGRAFVASLAVGAVLGAIVFIARPVHPGSEQREAAAPVRRARDVPAAPPAPPPLPVTYLRSAAVDDGGTDASPVREPVRLAAIDDAGAARDAGAVAHPAPRRAARVRLVAPSEVPYEPHGL